MMTPENQLREQVLFYVFESPTKGKELPKRKVEEIQVRFQQFGELEVEQAISFLVNKGWLREEKKDTNIKLTSKGQESSIQIVAEKIKEYLAKKIADRKEFLTSDIATSINSGSLLTEKAIDFLITQKIIRHKGANKIIITPIGEGLLKKPRINYVEQLRELIFSNKSIAIGVLVFLAISALLPLILNMNKVIDVFSSKETSSTIEEESCEGTRSSNHKSYVLISELGIIPGSNIDLTKDASEKLHDMRANDGMDSLGFCNCANGIAIVDSANALGTRKEADIVIWGHIDSIGDSIKPNIRFEIINYENGSQNFKPIVSKKFQPIPVKELFTFGHPMKLTFGSQTKITEEITKRIIFFYGLLHYQTGNFRRSLQYLTSLDAYLQNPGFKTDSSFLAIVKLLEGNSHLYLKEFKSAESQLGGALELAPQNPYLLHNRGTANAMMGRRTQAMADYRKAFDADTNFIVALHNIGYLQERNRDYEEAYDTFTDLFERIDETSDFYAYKNEFHAGLEVLAKKINRVPPPPPPIDSTDFEIEKPKPPKVYHYATGNTLFKSGDYRSAIEQYSLAIQKGENVEQSHYERARCNLKLKNFKSAVKDFEAAKSLEDEEEDFNLYYGEALMGAKQFHEAAALYSKALDETTSKKSSKVYSVYKSRGDAYKGAKEYRSAVESYLKMTESGVANQKAEGYYEAAKAYNLWRKADEAIEHYRKYLEMVPSTRNIRIYSEAFKVCQKYDRSNEFFVLLKMYCEAGGSMSAIEKQAAVVHFKKKNRIKYMGTKCKN